MLSFDDYNAAVTTLTLRKHDVIFVRPNGYIAKDEAQNLLARIKAEFAACGIHNDIVMLSSEIAITVAQHEQQMTVVAPSADDLMQSAASFAKSIDDHNAREAVEKLGLKFTQERDHGMQLTNAAYTNIIVSWFNSLQEIDAKYLKSVLQEPLVMHDQFPFYASEQGTSPLGIINALLQFLFGRRVATMIDDDTQELVGFCEYKDPSSEKEMFTEKQMHIDVTPRTLEDLAPREEAE